MNISTSLICCDLSNLKSEIDTLLENDLYWLHADFMDGHFVPRYGISPELIQWIRKRYGNNVIIDSHMMVSDPYTYADVIAPYSDWYFFHYESVTDPFRTLQMLRKKYPNLKTGIVFNLMTSTETVHHVLDIGNDYIDGVMFMGISPGVLGTNSLPNDIKSKLLDIKYSREWCKTFVDGSVSFDSITPYKEAGAYTVVCGGSTLLKNVPFDNNRYTRMNENIEKIKSLLNERA